MVQWGLGVGDSGLLLTVTPFPLKQGTPLRHPGAQLAGPRAEFSPDPELRLQVGAVQWAKGTSLGALGQSRKGWHCQIEGQVERALG